MKGSVDYHRSAVRYNEVLAEAAEGLENDSEINDPEVAGWARGVGKQHRFHAKRHKAAMDKLEKNPPQPVSSDSTVQQDSTVEAQVATLEPADVPVEVPTLAPAEVEVDVDLTKEN